MWILKTRQEVDDDDIEYNEELPQKKTNFFVFLWFAISRLNIQNVVNNLRQIETESTKN